jgi:DNA polymerase
MIHLDFETRSAADLKEVGAYRYAADRTTRILMAGVSEDDGEVYLWVNPDFRIEGMEGDPEADALLARIERENPLTYAHNAPFEAAMVWGKGRTSGFPIQLRQWRCTAAMARKAGLPSSLEKCAEVLGLTQQKDKGGAALIRFFCVPKKDGTFNEPSDFPEKFKAFGDYCKQDVRTEKAIHRKLKAFELREGPLDTFLFDLRMNERGIPVNVPALRNAQAIIEQSTGEVGVQFRELTGLEPGQRAKVLALLQSLGCKLDDMQADTLDQFVAPNPQAARVIELYRKTSYAATAKVAKMLDCVCPDGRIRGTHLYYGASTGRWSGRLIQPQNFKKPPRWMKGFTDEVFQRIGRGITGEELSLVYGDPLEAISGVVRNFIGNGVLDGDYNAIEGRVACWRAGQKDILKDWADGKDLYLRAVAFVYDELEELLSKKDPRRDFGKVVELAAQYGLGVDGFIRTCANWGITVSEDIAFRAIHEYYRPTHREIVARWYQLDGWAREAITYPGAEFGPLSCRTIAGIKYLLLKLPSGRSLAFPHIEINRRPPTPEEKAAMAEGKTFREDRFLEITYYGNIAGNTWGRVKLHGSLIFQNEIQAIAADLIAHGSLQAEKRGCPPFMLVHDQALAEKTRPLADFVSAFTSLPAWAKGLPLVFEAKEAPYYKK